jgi:hypothetical protein
MKNPQRVFAFHPFGVRLTAAQATSRPKVRDIAWAAGFYEGEGSCNFATYSQHVTIGQVEREPLDRLRRFFGGTVTARPGHDYGSYKSRPTNTWVIHGPRARGFLLTIYAFLSAKRQAQIRKVLHATQK